MKALIALIIVAATFTTACDPAKLGGSSTPAPATVATSEKGSHHQAPTSTKVAKTYDEVADNHRGVQVFPDTAGSAPIAVLRFGTHVQVECWAENESGMSSINAFYKIVSVGSNGESGYAPANTFANGDKLGEAGSTQIDPRVPKCSE